MQLDLLVPFFMFDGSSGWRERDVADEDAK
jgi:hypothetical protein